MLNYQVKLEKARELWSDEIDFQLISLYLVEEDRKDVIKTIPFVLQIEGGPKIYKEVMSYKD